MPACTVSRTHHRGKRLHQRDWVPVEGPVDLDRVYLSQLNRNANRLRVLRRHPNDGGNTKDAIPPLYDPQLLTFGTEFGAMITGSRTLTATLLSGLVHPLGRVTMSGKLRRQ